MMRYVIAALFALSIVSSAQAQTTIVSDTFTAATGTTLPAHGPDTNLPGAPWTVVSGATPTISSSGRATASGASISLIDSSTPNGTISTWWYPGSSPNLFAGLVFRATDAQNFYVFRMNADRLAFYRVVNGTWTQLWLQFLPNGEPRGSAHHLQASLSGTTITVSWDFGVHTFTTTDWFNVNARRVGLEWTQNDLTSTYDVFTVSGVWAATPATTSVSPASGSVVFEGGLNLTATGLDGSGNTVSGLAFDWATSNPALATVAPTGINTALVTGRGVGNVTITATPVRGPAASATVQTTPGQTIAFDGFDGPNGTNLTAHAPDVNQMGLPWTATGPMPTISNGRLSGSSDSVALLEGGTPNATVQVAWKAGTSTLLDGGLVFRASDASNFFLFRMFQTCIYLYRVVNGVYTNLPSQCLDSDPRPQEHWFQVVLSGSTITANWDFGVKQLTWTDTFNISATKYGLWRSGYDGTSTFDHFRITGTLPPPPTTVTVTPGANALVFEGSANLTARAYDGNGVEVTNTAFQWSSSNPQIASIHPLSSNQALLIGTGIGTATITATPSRGSASGTATVNVTPGLTIIADPFTGSGSLLHGRAPTVDQMGSGWSTSGALVPALTNDRAGATGSSGLAVALIDGGTPNVTALVNWDAGTAPNLHGGLVFRARDDNNFFVWEMFADRLRLLRFVNGAQTELWTRSLGGAPSGRHTLRVILEGQNISLYWDSELEAVVVDTFNINATRYGLRWSFYDTSSTYDDFRVTGALAPPATRVVVSPATATAPFLQQVTLTATAYDAADTVIPGMNFTWTSSSPSVSVLGVTTSVAIAAGMAEGSATITAIPSRGPSGSAAVTVDPGTTLIYDSFTASNGNLTGHTPEVTQIDRPWVVPGTAMPLVTNGRLAAPTGGDTALAVIESGAPNATVATTWRYNGTRSGVNYPVAGVVVRASDANNFFVAYVADVSIVLARVAHGAWSYLAAVRYADENYLATGQHRLEVRLLGPAIEVWVDGDRKIQATDSFNQGSGQHGVWWWTFIDRVSTFDDFSITGPLAPVVATLTVDQASLAIAPYETTLLTATARDASGQIVPGAVVVWESSAPAIAEVNPSSFVSGTVTPLFEGPATLTARDVRGTAPTVTIPVTVRICVDPLTSASTSVSPDGGIHSFDIFAPAGCTWRAVPLAPWLTVTSGASSNGSGTVTFSAAANGTFFTRTGFVAAGGRLFEVTQAPQANTCVQGLSAGQTHFTAGGGDGDFGVSADPNCNWQQTSSDPGWLIPLEGFSQGSGSPRFRVLPNDTPWERTGTIGIQNAGGFLITQAGNPSPPPTPPPPVPPEQIVGGTVQYYHTDAIGSVRLITNETGGEVAQYDYLPFGEHWNQSTVADSRRFVSKEHDQNTQFDYFGARYYASFSGRFTTVDPALNIETALSDPQRWNRYSYAVNRPLAMVDVDGREAGYIYAATGRLLSPYDADFPRSQHPFRDTVALAAAVVGGLFGGSIVVSAPVVAVGLPASQIALNALNGRLTETAAGIVKNTERIVSATRTAAYRIPDFLDHSMRVIGEVKNNTTMLRMTNQLRDLIEYARNKDYTFVLKVTDISKVHESVKKAIADIGGKIVQIPR